MSRIKQCVVGQRLLNHEQRRKRRANRERSSVQNHRVSRGELQAKRDATASAMQALHGEERDRVSKKLQKAEIILLSRAIDVMNNRVNVTRLKIRLFKMKILRHDVCPLKREKWDSKIKQLEAKHRLLKGQHDNLLGQRRSLRLALDAAGMAEDLVEDVGEDVGDGNEGEDVDEDVGDGNEGEDVDVAAECS